MGMPTRIQKGCASIKGTSRIRHLASLGGDLAHTVNRLYMLTVKRESLTNKKRSFENQVVELNRALKDINAEIAVTSKKSGRLSGSASARGNLGKTREATRTRKAVSLEY